MLSASLAVCLFVCEAACFSLCILALPKAIYLSHSLYFALSVDFTLCKSAFLSVCINICLEFKYLTIHGNLVATQFSVIFVNQVPALHVDAVVNVPLPNLNS